METCLPHLCIEIQPAGQMDLAELAYIHDWLWQAFADEVSQYEWGEGDWHVCARLEGQLIGHLDLTERQALAGGQAVRLGGVGGVVTRPDWRRRGVAAAMLGRAADFLYQPLAVDFGLLVCRSHLVAYYARLGWQVVPGPLVFDQPGGKATFDESETVMVLPVRQAVWPVGTIDLCGLPW